MTTHRLPNDIINQIIAEKEKFDRIYDVFHLKNQQRMNLMPTYREWERIVIAPLFVELENALTWRRMMYGEEAA